MHHDGVRLRPRSGLAFAALLALSTFAVASYQNAPLAHAEVTAVKGSAYGYFTDVSLFGGPSSTHGPAPQVNLPAAGSATPITDTLPEGGKGQYGPAVVFGGIWPDEAPSGPPSGPITVSTQGTMGADGSVISSVDIVLYDPRRPLEPGGIGPGPLIADEAHSRCVAGEGGVTGSSRFVNGKVETKYDKDTQLPIPSAVKPIPVNPPPNQEYTGTIDHVGDHFRIVINEQIQNRDGSLTVNAAHMFLLGPIAIGEMIVGQSVCGVRGSPSPAPAASPGPAASPTPAPAPGPGDASPTTAPPPPPATNAGPAPTTPAAPTDPAASTSTTAPALTFSWQSGPSSTSAPRSKDDGEALAARPVRSTGSGGFPTVLVVLALGVGAAAAVIVVRRRRLAGPGRPPNGRL